MKRSKPTFASEPVSQDPQAMARQMNRDLTKLEGFTDNLIDAPMNEFLEQISTYSIGSLKAISVFFDDKQRRIGVACDEFSLSKEDGATFSQEYLLTVATSYVVLQKIIDRKAAVEFYIKQRAI